MALDALHNQTKEVESWSTAAMHASPHRSHTWASYVDRASYVDHLARLSRAWLSVALRVCSKTDRVTQYPVPAMQPSLKR